ncbi:MAG: AI-2E family transporter [Planctomycetota bacterium]
MLERLTPTWRNVILAALFIALLLFSWQVRAVLNPLIAGYFLAYVVHPMVVKLERKGFSRKAAVNWIFFGVVVLTFLVSVGVYFQSVRLIGEVANDSPDGLRAQVTRKLDEEIAQHQPTIESWMERLFGDEEAEGAEDEEKNESDEAAGAVDPSPGEEGPTEASGEESGDEVDQDGALDGSLEEGGVWDVKTLLARVFAEIDRESAVRAGQVGLDAAGIAWRFLQRAFGSMMAFLTFFFLLPIYTWFLLFELGNIHRFVSRYLPRSERERISRIGRQIGEVLSSFFRGRLLVALAKGILITIGLSLAGVDYALLIGLSSGFLSLIPFVGALLGGVFAFLVALMDHSFVPALVRVLIIYLSAEVIEGYVLVPKIIGDSLGLPPVVVLFTVFVGGAALGVFGLLLALPLTASILILVREFVLPALADFADEGEGGDADGDGEPDVFSGTPPGLEA